ncbi:acyltransferase family protein [Paenibacillus hodogayensis]|uniref:Acyltransferase family protein n=1 Tax=Paenibacillus hodogayensis TaxID=279208 RepID=A0ABV5W8E1_9BACL
MEKKLIPEMFVLRSIACLCLVFRNSLNRTFPESSLLGNFFELLLTFGTPAFIFISEMILAHSSRNSVDKQFWSKRIQFILAPYFVFGAFYACMKSVQVWAESREVEVGTLFTFLWRHWLLGDYHGYFILIVFQFYALHKYMKSLDNRYSPQVLLGASLVINVAYLAIFNLVPSPGSAVLHYVWSKAYWIPFPGWAFYFVVAYYCGSRYELFKKLLLKYGGWTWAAVSVTAVVCWIVLQQGWITSVSSKRIDMIFFALSAMFFISYLVMRIGKVSLVFMHISRYSFGIYLLHPMFLAFMFVPLQMFPSLRNNWLTVVVLFLGSIGCSVLMSLILNKTKWGPYMIGKVGASEKGRAQYEKIPNTKKVGIG